MSGNNFQSYTPYQAIVGSLYRAWKTIFFERVARKSIREKLRNQKASAKVWDARGLAERDICVSSKTCSSSILKKCFWRNQGIGRFSSFKSQLLFILPLRTQLCFEAALSKQFRSRCTETWEKPSKQRLVTLLYVRQKLESSVKMLLTTTIFR